MTASDTHAAIDAVWRIESAKLIGALVRIVRDISLAEELAQDALVAALQQWPSEGIPRNPGAWLMQAAKHRAIDHFRHRQRADRKHEQVAYELEGEQDRTPDFDTALDDDVGDDVLRLMFVACHPVLSADARVALTLRLLGGLTTEEIARAYLVPEPTIAQRIVRAKKAIARTRVPFEVPRGADRAARLASVLEVIYLIFNEGYSATAGDDWVRPQLCEDAMRLGRVLAGLAPDESEVHGLVALMELQASRLRARTSRTGAPILLLDQDRARWDHVLIQHGLAALARAEALDGAGGSYALQAAIAACHARARTAAATDWRRIARLYGDLARVMPSPVVDLNRAMAVAMAGDPQTALAIVDAIASHATMREYPHWFGARGDLLAKLGRHEEARGAFTRAAELTKNARDRDVLLKRVHDLEHT